MNKSRIGLFLGFQLIAMGCASLVSEQEHPCPCSSQWVCCANVCVPEGTACTTADSGVSLGDSAGLLEPDSSLGTDSGAPIEASPPSDVGTDSGAPIEASPPSDGGFQRPAACANPGPFTDQPTASSLPSLIIGTWIDCDHSWFAGAGVPTNEVGVIVRADGTWQKLGVSGGQLVLLTRHEDYGTWSIYGGGCCGEMLDLSWDTSSIASGSKFTADGTTVFVDTAGGNTAILAKVTDGVSDSGIQSPDDGEAAVGSTLAQCAGTYVGHVTNEQACWAGPFQSIGPTSDATITVTDLADSGGVGDLGQIEISNGDSMTISSESDSGGTFLISGGESASMGILIYGNGTLDCSTDTLIFETWAAADATYPCDRQTWQLTRQ